MPAAGSTDSDDQSRVRREQPPQPLVRPAPEILRRGVVDLHAVSRGEHPPPGCRHAPQLAHGLRGIVAVLEDLRAQHDVEGGVGDRERLDGAAQLRGGVLDDVDADVLTGDVGEERQVGLRPAADVEDTQPPVRRELVRLRAQPRRERRPHDPRRRRPRRVAPLRPRPPREVPSGHGPSVAQPPVGTGPDYRRRERNAANAGFRFPESVTRPDCQPPRAARRAAGTTASCRRAGLRARSRTPAAGRSPAARRRRRTAGRADSSGSRTR